MINLIFMVRKDPQIKLLIPNKIQTARDTHIYGMMITFLIVLGGFLAIFVNKIKKGSDHFTSWHGKFGLITFILIVLQMVNGLVKRWPDKFWVFGSKAYVQKNFMFFRKLHAYFGGITGVIATVTLCLSFYTTWFQSNVNAIWPHMHILFMAITIFGYLLVVIQINNKYAQTTMAIPGVNE
jgi:hypothetical protein